MSPWCNTTGTTSISRPLRRMVCLLLAAMLLAAVPAYAGEPAEAEWHVEIPASHAELVNPYIGSAAWASDTSEREQPFTLVYADLTWAEFEPRQGKYDFKAFEERNNLAYWREQGVHVIFRFVLDMPNDEPHRDIPDWLYEKTGDGEDYDNSYGYGYSPNYANPVLIKAHAKAIAALGRKYGNNRLFAYVQLGSLGHWGEWHIRSNLPAMPPEDIRDQYVMPYLKAFPRAKIMMRRPFAIAAKEGLGLFNDTAGAEEPTREWLDWIDHGGEYSQTGEPNALVAMPDGWKTAPIGGELNTRMEKEDMLSEDGLPMTLELMELSHTSWMGPGSFVNIKRGGPEQDALGELNRVIGYRLRVSDSQVQIAPSGKVTLTLTWQNDGIAPFYFDWVPAVRIKGPGRRDVTRALKMDLINVLPGEPVTASVSFTPARSRTETWTAYAGILNPSTNEPGVMLAMDTQSDGLWYQVATGQQP